MITLIKQQFSVTHIIRQTTILALVDSCVSNTPSVKMLFPEKKCFLLYFRKIIIRLTVGLLKIGQVMSVRCKTVYRWCRQFAVARAACGLVAEGGWNGLIIMLNLVLCIKIELSGCATITFTVLRQKTAWKLRMTLNAEIVKRREI